MSRYIDVEEVTRAIVKRAVESTMDLNTVGDIINIVQDFSTADVVEVVRCKDCKHQEHCSIWMIALSNIDFCSYGERREDGEIH